MINANVKFRDACAFTDVDGDTTIVTGGQFTQFKATRYNLTVGFNKRLYVTAETSCHHHLHVAL